MRKEKTWEGRLGPPAEACPWRTPLMQQFNFRTACLLYTIGKHQTANHAPCLFLLLRPQDLHTLQLKQFYFILITLDWSQKGPLPVELFSFQNSPIVCLPKSWQLFIFSNFISWSRWEAKTLFFIESPFIFANYFLDRRDSINKLTSWLPMYTIRPPDTDWF